jgi:hypothetical protein
MLVEGKLTRAIKLGGINEERDENYVHDRKHISQRGLPTTKRQRALDTKVLSKIGSIPREAYFKITQQEIIKLRQCPGKIVHTLKYSAKEEPG